MADKFAESRHGAVARGLLLNYDPSSLVIVTDKADPLYDPRVEYPVAEWMVESIIEHGGVYEPIVVTKDGTDKHGRPIVKVIDGRQRVRACIEANKRMKKAGKEPFTVPGTPQSLSEDKLANLVVVLNEHKVTDIPSVRAEKMAQMQNRGASNADIARAFRVSGPTVASYLRLAASASFVQKAVDRGELPLSTASSLYELPRSEQVEAVKKMLAEGTVRGKAGKEAADEARGPRPKKDGKPERKLSLSTLGAWGPAEVALVDKALAYAQQNTESLDDESYGSGVLFGFSEVFRLVRAGKDGAKELTDAIYARTNKVMEDAGVETEDDEEGDDE